MGPESSRIEKGNGKPLEHNLHNFGGVQGERSAVAGRVVLVEKKKVSGGGYT